MDPRPPQQTNRPTAQPQVIMATNRADTLDPALLRPGRLDRKIEFPMPDRRQKRLIFTVRAPALAWECAIAADTICLHGVTRR